MMHKIILQFFKIRKSHGLHFELPFLCGLCYYSLINGVCVRVLELVKFHIKKCRNKINNELNFKTILMDF